MSWVGYIWIWLAISLFGLVEAVWMYFETRRDIVVVEGSGKDHGLLFLAQLFHATQAIKVASWLCFFLAGYLAIDDRVGIPEVQGLPIDSVVILLVLGQGLKLVDNLYTQAKRQQYLRGEIKH